MEYTYYHLINIIVQNLTELDVKSQEVLTAIEARFVADSFQRKNKKSFDLETSFREKLIADKVKGEISDISI